MWVGNTASIVVIKEPNSDIITFSNTHNNLIDKAKQDAASKGW